MSEYRRFENETEEEYGWRLYSYLKNGEMTWDTLADFMNQECRESEDEYRSSCAYRKPLQSAERYYNAVFSKMNGGCDNVSTRILCVSDCHVPYQLSINKLEKYKGKVDILHLNGDIGDCQAISTFPKVYRKSPMEEIIETRQYIIDMIDYIKPKKVILNFGNHDLRFQSYLAKNLDTDILELMPQTALELICVDGFKHYNKREKTKVEYKPLVEVFDDVEVEYTGNWFNQIGDCIFAHPKAFSTGILKTAEKAMLWFRNEGYNFKTLVLAHTHRSGMYCVGNTTIYEQGAFCDTKANNYSDGQLYNSQKEGFIYLCQDKEGNTIKDKTKLVVLN